jgi:Ca2+-transporting ATPase
MTNDTTDNTEKEVRVVPPWHCMTKEEVIKELGLPPDIRRVGLTTAEAQARLEKYGENKLTEAEKESIWLKIWRQVNNVLVAILVFVTVISVYSAVDATVKGNSSGQYWIEAVIIIGVVM